MKLFRQLSMWASSKKGAKITIAVWLIAVIALSGVAPGAKEFAGSSKEESVYENSPSQIAKQLQAEHFPSDDGLPAIVVFYSEAKITEKDEQQFQVFSEWMMSDAQPEHVASSIPYHFFPEETKQEFLSEDQTTFIYSFSMTKEATSDDLFHTLEEIRAKLNTLPLDHFQIEMTGPAGIAADTITLFKNADLVLIFATVALILIILFVIYRSPILAMTPLVIAGITYQIVDRLIGIAGQNNWFFVDKQALSIMMILLFAVLTDYCLFIFSRFREELQKVDCKYTAMQKTMHRISEPIFFSGGTILVAVATLFIAVFQPYHYFAPVFSVAIVILFLAGLTLIPAVFGILGRKSFWPFIPKLGVTTARKSRFWSRVASLVTKRPGWMGGVLFIVMVIASLNVANMQYSFNLLNSFPEGLSSKQGFERIEQQFPQGKLAEGSLLVVSDKPFEWDATLQNKLEQLQQKVQSFDGIEEVSPLITDALFAEDARLPRHFLSEDLRAIQFDFVLASNPYEQEALDLLDQFLTQSETWLIESGLDPLHHELHFAGQTAEQVDVRTMSQRDAIFIIGLVSVLILVMLSFQAQSIRLAFIMMFTIVLSYTATMGLGWFIFENILGYEAISYRLPVYAFVFLVALGVDYNIMLVSRIREEAVKLPWVQAVERGVSLTGSVISSAGVILAATFLVLTTQPLQELFLFGLIMSIGILIDTFLVRGILFPSILTLTAKAFDGKQKVGE